MHYLVFSKALKLVLLLFLAVVGFCVLFHDYPTGEHAANSDLHLLYQSQGVMKDIAHIHSSARTDCGLGLTYLVFIPGHYGANGDTALIDIANRAPSDRLKQVNGFDPGVLQPPRFAG